MVNLPPGTGVPSEPKKGFGQPVSYRGYEPGTFGVAFNKKGSLKPAIVGIPNVGGEVKKTENKGLIAFANAAKEAGIEPIHDDQGNIISVTLPEGFIPEEEHEEKVAQIEAMKNGDLSILKDLIPLTSQFNLLKGRVEPLKEKLQNPQTLALLEIITEETEKLAAEIKDTPSRLKLDGLKAKIEELGKMVERAKTEVSKIPVPPTPTVAPTAAPTSPPTPAPLPAPTAPAPTAAPTPTAAPKSILRPKGVLTTWPTYIRFDDAKNRNAWWYSKNPKNPELLNSKEWSEAAADIKPIFDEYLSFMKEGGFKAQIKKEELFGDLIAAKEKVTDALDAKKPGEAIEMAHELREALILAKEQWIKAIAPKKEEIKNEAEGGVFARQKDEKGNYVNKKFVGVFQPVKQQKNETQKDIEDTRRQNEIRSKFEKMLRNDENGFIGLYTVASIDPATNGVIYTENEALRKHPYRGVITEVLAAHGIAVTKKSEDELERDAQKQAEKDRFYRTGERLRYSPTQDKPSVQKLSLLEKVDKFMLGIEPKTKKNAQPAEDLSKEAQEKKIAGATADVLLKDAPYTTGMVKESKIRPVNMATGNVFATEERYEALKAKASSAVAPENKDIVERLRQAENEIDGRLAIAKQNVDKSTAERSHEALKKAVAAYEKEVASAIEGKQALSPDEELRKKEALKKVNAIIATRTGNLAKNPKFVNAQGVLRAAVLMAVVATAGTIAKVGGDYLNTLEDNRAAVASNPGGKKLEWRKFYLNGKHGMWKDLPEEMSTFKLDKAGDLMRKYVPLYFKNSNSVSAALGLDGNSIKFGPKEGDADPYSHMPKNTREELIALWNELEAISMATKAQELQAITFEDAFKEVARKVAEKER